MPRRKIIVVGAAFRQSKVLFEYMDTIWKNAPILRDLCGSNSGPRRDVDRCVMHIGDSTITCLPLGDGSKIRGQRANDIIADEFASIPREIFENVVAGFAAVSASPIEKVKEDLSVDKIKASDGKTYKFLGSQWAELLPSGKTGLFAKKKIGKELDKLTGRKRESVAEKKKKKTKKELDPSSESLANEKQLPQVYVEREGLGLLSYLFLIIIVAFSIVGILKTFENDLLDYFPKISFIYELLDEQLEFLAETVKNMIVIVKDLLSSY